MSDRFLVMTLAGARGAFGEVAGETRRGTLDVPGRSAIIGLVAACLGIRNADTERLDALGVWKVAVGVISQGTITRDFHTVHTVNEAIIAPRTRAEALREGARRNKIHTVLTQRDYLNDPAFSVALWGGENHEELREALLHPTFAPYLGRKSCPLAAPMAPKVVEAEGPVAALHMAKMPPWLEKEGKKKGEKESKKPYRIHSDPHPTIDPDRVERRWDVPLSREDWFFAARDVHVQDLQGEEA